MRPDRLRPLELPATWRTESLTAVTLSLTSGGRPEGGGSDNAGGVFSIGGEHITSCGSVVFSPAVYVPCDFFEAIRDKAEVRDRDILINKDGANTGKLAFVRGNSTPEPACVNEHVFRLRTDASKIDQTYAFYFLLSSFGQRQILPLVQGSAQPGLNQRFTKHVHIWFPSQLSEQAAIGQILDAVDTALARTQAAIGRARDLKRAVLQRFFYEALGETAYADRPRKQLPHGWSLVPTKQLLTGEPKNGVSPESSSQPPGIPTFSIAAVRDGRVDLDSREHLKYTRIEDIVAQRYQIAKGDVLIVRGNANPGLVGKAGMVVRFPARCIYPDITKRVVFRTIGETKVSPEFAVLAWNHDLVHNQVLRRAKTSNGTLKINSRDVKQIVMPVPPEAEQAQLVKADSAVARQISALTEVHRAYEQLKKALMHDLLTGRVRVSFAAKAPAV